MARYAWLHHQLRQHSHFELVPEPYTSQNCWVCWQKLQPKKVWDDKKARWLEPHKMRQCINTDCRNYHQASITLQGFLPSHKCHLAPVCSHSDMLAKSIELPLPTNFIDSLRRSDTYSNKATGSVQTCPRTDSSGFHALQARL